jgi:hypothetical protein
MTATRFDARFVFSRRSQASKWVELLTLNASSLSIVDVVTFQVTHWLQEIGGINSNSYGRFMKATGADGGAENGTYEAAYVPTITISLLLLTLSNLYRWLYFEKNRILQDKKKTPKRIRNEKEHPNGLSRRSGHRGVWVLGR